MSGGSFRRGRRQRGRRWPRETQRPDARRWIAHLENRLTYERALLAESGGTADAAFRHALAIVRQPKNTMRTHTAQGGKP